MKYKTVSLWFAVVKVVLRDIPPFAHQMNRLVAFRAERGLSRQTPLERQHAGLAHVAATTNMNYGHVRAPQMWYVKNVASVLRDLK